MSRLHARRLARCLAADIDLRTFGVRSRVDATRRCITTSHGDLWPLEDGGWLRERDGVRRRLPKMPAWSALVEP